MKNSKQASFTMAQSLFFLSVAMILIGLTLGFFPWYQQKVANGFLQINGFFLYEETVVAMPDTGVLLPCYPQGTRVGRGETTALNRSFTLNGASCSALRAPNAGKVYYSVDGLEGALSVGRAENISATEILAVAEKKGYSTNDGIKIINNHAPIYLTGVFNKKSADKVTVGETTMLSVNRILTQGQLLKKFYDKGNVVCLFRLDTAETWLQNRFVSVKLLKNDTKNI